MKSKKKIVLDKDSLEEIILQELGQSETADVPGSSANNRFSLTKKVTSVLIKDLNLLFMKSEPFYFREFWLRKTKGEQRGPQYSSELVRLLGSIRLGVFRYLVTLEQNSADTMIAMQRMFGDVEQQMSRQWEIALRQFREKDRQLILEYTMVKNEMQKQLSFMYQIMRESPVGVVCLDKELSVLHWNSMAAKITGYRSVDILKRSILTIFTQSSRNSFLKRINSDRKRYPGFRLYIEPKIGVSHQIFISISKMKEGAPDQIMYILSLQDIGLESLRNTRNKSYLNQLTTISRLTAAIMHDIRNPFHRIGLNAELLEQHIISQKKLQTPEILNLTEKIITEIHQLSRQLEHYLSYSQLAESHLEEIELIAPLESLYEELKFEAAMKSIAIHFHSSQKKLHIFGDWIQLRRLFLNVIQNAIEAIEEKGLQGGTIEIKVNRCKKRVYITCLDSGCGLTGDIRNNIFRPFFTTKRTGTGLGLFIAREIVRMHRGKLTCLPRKEGGTRIAVSFPLRDFEVEADDKATVNAHS